MLSALEGLTGSSIATLGDQEPSLICCPLLFFLPLPLPRFEDAFEEDEKSEDLGLRSPVSGARRPADFREESECRNEIPIRVPIPPSISLFQRAKPDLSLIR
jgi:hypothetical protein